jgi:hypothetical protein
MIIMSFNQIQKELYEIDQWIIETENKLPKSIQNDYNKAIQEFQRLQIKPKILFQMELPQQEPLTPMLQVLDMRTRETEFVLKKTHLNLVKLAEAMAKLKG